MNRLGHPLKKLATTSGPVAIGIFDDGTIMVGGPNDPPLLIRNGAVMRLDPSAVGERDGDLVFHYEGLLNAIGQLPSETEK